jgi:ribosomal protein L32
MIHTSRASVPRYLCDGYWNDPSNAFAECKHGRDAATPRRRGKAMDKHALWTCRKCGFLNLLHKFCVACGAAKGESK